MRYLRVFLYLAPLFLIVLSFFVIPRLIKIRNISCTDQYGPCPEAVEAKVKGALDANLAEALGDVSGALKNDVLVSSFTTQFMLPDRLVINMVVRKPAFALKSVNAEGYALVAKNKVVVAIVPSTNLPTLKIQTNIPNVGEQVGEKQFFALNILNGMFYLYQIREGEIEEDSLKVQGPSGMAIIFPLAGDKDALIGAVRIILSRLNEAKEDSKIKNVTLIDLRFKNPVLK